MTRKELSIGDVYVTRALRDTFGFTSENLEAINVDPSLVPLRLRPLIEDVERWAISCDVTRADYFAQQSEDEIDAFWRRVNPYIDEIDSWLESLGDDVTLWPSSAVQFLDLLTAHQDAWRPTPEEQIALEARQAIQSRRIALTRAVSLAAEAFSSKNHGLVVRLLEPFETGLDKVSLAKLAYSRRKV